VKDLLEQGVILLEHCVFNGMIAGFYETSVRKEITKFS
jgi:hypothetical protein